MVIKERRKSQLQKFTLAADGFSPRANDEVKVGGKKLAKSVFE